MKGLDQSYGGISNWRRDIAPPRVQVIHAANFNMSPWDSWKALTVAIKKLLNDTGCNE